MASDSSTTGNVPAPDTGRTTPILNAISYTEYLGTEREWRLEGATFDKVNLIVGKNASGKSRLLNIIHGLARIVTGDIPKVFDDGNYEVKFSTDTHQYVYVVSFRQRTVNKEVLVRGGETLLERGPNGVGTIWAEKLGQRMDFEAPNDQLASRLRRDSIQHSFLEDLHAWAFALRFYQFGTPLGRENLLIVSDAVLYDLIDPEIRDANQVLKLYIKAFKEFGDDFDKAVLSDLHALGYDCIDVGVEPVDSAILSLGQTPPMVWLYVRERDVNAKIPQTHISQGMFRALSLVIHLNDCLFRRVPRTILIDDIGEGLDFSRSQSFVSLLIERALANGLQLIMTTNDRFVMNGVPLQYWGVLSRNAGNVRIYTAQNSPQVFAEFEELGLNNFDFFASRFFETDRAANDL